LLSTLTRDRCTKARPSTLKRCNHTCRHTQHTAHSTHQHRRSIRRHIAVQSTDMAFPLARASRMLLAGCSTCLPRRVATAAPLATFNLQIRNYAKKQKRSSQKDNDDEGTTVIKTKGKQSKKSTSFASNSSGFSNPGEEPLEASESAIEELEKTLLDKAAVRMDKAVERFQGQAYDGVERGKGRITPGKASSRVRVPRNADPTRPS
jgi:hypothetical protein